MTTARASSTGVTNSHAFADPPNADRRLDCAGAGFTDCSIGSGDATSVAPEGRDTFSSLLRAVRSGNRPTYEAAVSMPFCMPTMASSTDFVPVRAAYALSWMAFDTAG